MAVIADFPAYPEWVSAAKTVEVLRTGPDGRRGFAPESTVDCEYVEADLGGNTPKFLCALPGGERVKVKFGATNGEVYAESVATGAIISGRRTFELAGRWNGDHHDGVPILVLTHHVDEDDVPPGSARFYTDVGECAAAAREGAVAVAHERFGAVQR